MDRVILHCDCNAFFASVETALNPRLKTVPMAVCGDPRSRHGIILAKNELAKSYQIKTAETIGEAKRKCPELVLVSPHHQLYEEYSRRIFNLYTTFTDQVEPFGIDEAWLDVTGSRTLFGDGRRIADTIREKVRAEIGLTVSVGVSFNKVFAKLASDYKKPDATTVFDYENFRQNIFSLPVGDLLLVGKSAAAALHLMGIKTIGDLASAPLELLLEKFGKLGVTLHQFSNGLDDSPVSVFGMQEPLKSVGNTITFRRDLLGEDDIRIGLRALADKVATRLRKHKVLCSAVTAVIKDPSLKTITRQCTLKVPTDLSGELFDASFALVKSSWNPGKVIRMLGITGSRLISATEFSTQISLFEETGKWRERAEKKEDAMDAIRARFGTDIILSGALLKNDIGTK